MKLLFAVVLLALPAWTQDWSLESLYRRPFVWGNSPDAGNLKWSEEGHTLAFLWNEEGRRFLDLYAYHPDTGKRVRLTNMEPVKDEINFTEAEKDDRQKQYLAPPAGLSNVSLSRDGSLAAFDYRGDVYTVVTNGARPPFRLTKTKAAESNPKLSPDGKLLAFVRDGQLYVQDLAAGQLTQVTDLEGFDLTDYDWSPNGRKFVYAVEKGTERKVPLPNYSGKFVKAPTFSRSVAGDKLRESFFYVISSEGGKPDPVEGPTWGSRFWASGPPKWSHDSTRLLYRAVHPAMKKQEIRQVDLRTSKAITLYEQTDEKWVYWSFCDWSPDSSQVFFTSDAGGWAHLYRVAASGGKAEQLTRGAWEIHSEFQFPAEPQWVGDYLYFVSTEEGPSERHFYRIRSDGTGKQKLSNREGLNIGVVSADGRHTAWLLADLKNPFDLYVGTNRVTHSPLPEFQKYSWPETRFVTFPSPKDGKTVNAKILLPPGYRLEDRTQKPRPAVFFIHGAGYATSVLKQWGSYQEERFVFNCYLANKGYVVIDLDYRGSSGYGRDWRTDVYLHLGGPDLEDVLGGVEYLRGLGNIDMQRIGIWGVSYGGFMTNMAMFLSPDTFHAGASWAAVNDWENYNAYYTTQRLNTPKETPEAYRRSSPIHFSKGLKHPLLIVHGMVDNNVLFQDAVQLAEKLIQEGKDFGQAYYPQESHGFVREETLIDAFRRSAEWLDRHLQ